jgi:hypothetical protein
MADIIKAESKSHLIQLIHFSFMSPDLASKIINGNISSRITREKLKKDLPLSWIKSKKPQRHRKLGEPVGTWGENAQWPLPSSFSTLLRRKGWSLWPKQGNRSYS